MPEKKVYITELETAILRAFFDHLYMTSKEIAATLRVLADKVER